MGAKQSNQKAVQDEQLSTPPRKQTPQQQSIPNSALLSQFTPQEKVDIGHPRKVAFTIENCLTAEECNALIQFSEEKGYETALLNAGFAQVLATDTRKSERCMVDDENLAKDLWQRIQHVVPKTLTKTYGPTDNQIVKEYEAVGLNERLRFLRYKKGDYFVQHMDGTYERPVGHPLYGELSMVTYLLYLNEDFEGGALEMEWREDGNLSNRTSIVKKIQPKTGIVVVHDHRILHEAMVVTKGIRYCIRTDIMFRPKHTQNTTNFLKKAEETKTKTEEVTK
jgi:Rps23 Pro-64 3,4-dihydroxylase Tpa1-like proline 4-hydroxylase